ncbi:PAS domain-containing protein [Roseovarius salinarum]|uniref:PAS domain-containing protein n=1 Tax=Roseovarius salinarum TaxID=1981892 RepID=UPI000C32AD3C|nr:PAS domain-containing protein [Roseovarius salinarum]
MSLPRLTLGTKLALCFLLFGGPWVIVGDYLVSVIGVSGAYQPAQTFKGMVFVGLSCVLIKAFGDRLNSALQRAYRRERRLHAMLKHAEFLGKVGSWQKDIDTGEARVSDALASMLGGRPRQGEDITDLLSRVVHPEDRETVLAAHRDWLRDGGTLSHQFRILNSAGQTKWMEETAGFSTSEDGTPTAIGSVTDFTDLRQARVAYEKAQSRANNQQALIRMAAEKARFGGWRYEVGIGAEMWTDGAATVRDLPAGTVVSADEAMSYYALEDQQRLRQLFANCLEHGAPFDETFRLVTAKGRELTVRTTGDPEYDQSGRIVAAQGAIQDVTDLVEARREADRRNAQIRDVVESIGGGFMAVGTDGRCAFVNRRGLELLQVSKDSIEGRPIRDAFPSGPGGEFNRNLARAVENGENRTFIEYCASAGTWLEVHMHPATSGLGIRFSDITGAYETHDRVGLLEQAVLHMDDMVIIGIQRPGDADDDIEVVFVNPAFENGSGRGRAEVTGRSLRDLDGAGWDRAALQQIRASVAARQAATHDVPLRHADGSRKRIELDTFPVPGGNGDAVHWIFVGRDVTDEKVLRAN